MNEKKRSLFGWLGILFFGQFALVKFWYNHGTIRIPAENTFSWWAWFVIIFGLAFAGLFVMWSMIKNSKTLVPHKILWWIVVAGAILSWIISPPGSSEITTPDTSVNITIVGICVGIWFYGTGAIVIYDAICLRDELEDMDQKNLQT